MKIFNVAVQQINVVLVLCMALVLASPQSVLAETNPIKEQVRQSGSALPLKLSTQWNQKALERFYEQRGFQPVWFSASGEARDDLQDWYRLSDNAHLHALDGKDSLLRKVAAVDAEGNAQTAAAKDIAFTNEVIQYIKDVKTGRVNPSKIFPLLVLLPQDRDASQTLAMALQKDADEAIDYLLQFAPDHPQYRKLQKALLRHRELAQQGEWTPLKVNGLVKPGESSDSIPLIRNRLAQLAQLDRNEVVTHADANMPAEQAAMYDEALQTKIEAIQERYHIKVDGVIGPQTVDVLNLSLAQRIRQIELAMERWRWLPESLGEQYVFVNLAGFYAKGYRNGAEVIHTPIIVGKVAHETPAFSSHIENVKFYPDWTVPSSIAKRYLLDKVQRNPAAIHQLGYELYRDGQRVSWSNVNVNALSKSDFPPYRFRQKPGAKNALGLVRFSIDNPYAIFLHDTPNDALFDKNQRTFSSGCIRVAKPEALAQFVTAQNAAVRPNQITQMFEDGRSGGTLQTNIVPLNQPMPVHITYMTAWVDNDGVTQFAPDIYGRDAKLDKALKGDR
jgi:murein L,D-transpeptidase YcbB/YkuD